MERDSGSVTAAFTDAEARWRPTWCRWTAGSRPERRSADRRRRRPLIPQDSGGARGWSASPTIRCPLRPPHRISATLARSRVCSASRSHTPARTPTGPITAADLTNLAPYQPGGRPRTPQTSFKEPESGVAGRRHDPAVGHTRGREPPVVDHTPSRAGENALADENSPAGLSNRGLANRSTYAIMSSCPWMRAGPADTARAAAAAAAAARSS
jgi:hypothetical protein